MTDAERRAETDAQQRCDWDGPHYCACHEELSAKEQEVARLREQNQKLRDEVLMVVCSYCSFEAPVPTTAGVLQTHVLTECEFHPLRKLEAEVARLRAALEAILDFVAKDYCPDCDYRDEEDDDRYDHDESCVFGKADDALSGRGGA